MVKIFACKYEEDKEDILLDKMSLLRCEDIKRIERYKMKKDRCMSFLGLSMLYAFCERYKELSESFIILEDYSFLDQNRLTRNFFVKIDENGKPYFEGNENFFSISHSGDWTFLALSDKPVGIDVQIIKELKGSVAKRFFTEEENAYIDEDVNLSEERTIEVWCVKESYVKLIGKGLSYGLDSFKANFSENVIFDMNDNCIKAIFHASKFSDNYIYSYCELYQEG